MKPVPRASAVPRAFSLVEVVLALAIISFALLAMFGLISISLKADRDSSSDTVLAEMHRQVMGELRTGTFGNLPSLKYYYFDVDGSPCTPASSDVPANPPSAQYQCRADIAADQRVTDANYSVTANLKNVTLTFMWPVVSGSGPHSEVFHCDIANYGN